MSGTANDVITSALSEVGYLEKASNSELDDKTANAGSANYTKYGAWYGMNPAQWCAEFVSWNMEQGGAGELAPKYASCGVGINWFKANAQFHKRGEYMPQAGDVIFFSSATYPNGGAHTGIVESCDGTYVRTIEGNTSGGSTLVANGGGVAQKRYPLNYASIYGYGTPNYAAESESEEDMAMTGEQIYNALKEYTDTAEAPEWAKAELQEAVDAGITDGTRPMELIPRYQAAIMAKRAAGK